MKRYFSIICLALFVCASPSRAHQNLVSDSTTLIQSFNLLRAGSSVKILWQTAVEKNNNFFEVQRSTDGENFKVVAVVFAREEAPTGADYQYVDNPGVQAGQTVVYYRIRQVDMQQNGTLTTVRKFKVTEAR